MTAPEIIARLIADGNGELEDDRPAIADARAAIAAAKETVYPPVES